MRNEKIKRWKKLRNKKIQKFKTKNEKIEKQIWTNVSEKGASDIKNNVVSPILNIITSKSFIPNCLKKKLKMVWNCLKMVKNWYNGFKKVQDA